MRVEAIDPISGKTFTGQAEWATEESIRNLLEFDFSDEALRSKLDQLNISADAKSILFTIAKATIRVGGSVVKIGRKILDLIAGILIEYPQATMGLIFGAVIGKLVATIPIIGFVLGPLFGPLAIAMGLTVGVWQDISDKALARRVAATVASFDPLKTKGA